MATRRCSRSGCPDRAVATLTYVYTDSMAVLGPLATQAEPHGYDLCARHANRLSVPRGWEVIRLAVDEDPEPSTDDLLALADAVREVGLTWDQPDAGPANNAEIQRRTGVVELGRRGHLTVLADPDA
ncbi:MAG: DUF3499 domain-containing protein [Propionibacteriaceae bacterium]